jgi:N-terminal domain of anti-restriction factor ArdC
LGQYALPLATRTAVIEPARRCDHLQPADAPACGVTSAVSCVPKARTGRCTDKIIRELEQGRVPWVQPWAGVSAPLGLPRSAAIGRQYSGINILILWSAVAERGFSGQKWLTFRQALKIGAHVRKGEKGVTVVYADRFIPYRERTRAAETGDEPDAIPFLKRFTVFNADQCEDPTRAKNYARYLDSLHRVRKRPAWGSGGGVAHCRHCASDHHDSGASIGGWARPPYPDHSARRRRV